MSLTLPPLAVPAQPAAASPPQAPSLGPSAPAQAPSLGQPAPAQSALTPQAAPAPQAAITLPSDEALIRDVEHLRIAELPAPLITLYGDTKLGKTTLMAETFPTALFICRPGGMLPAYTFLGLNERHGLKPRTVQVVIDGALQDWTKFVFEWHIKSLAEITALAPIAKQLGFAALGVDDLSLSAGTYNRVLHNQLGDHGRAVFKRFDKIGNELATTTEGVRYLALPVVLTTHVRRAEMEPDGVGGTAIRPGGPKFPSKNLTDDLCYETDLLVHMRADPMSRGFGTVLDRTNLHYRGGDRLHVLPTVTMSNLRGPLVEGGHTVARYPGLEWQDGVMLTVCEWIEAGNSVEALAEALVPKLLAQGRFLPHIKWALRDGMGMAAARDWKKDAWREELFGASRAEKTKATVAAMGPAVPVVAAKKDEDED